MQGLVKGIIGGSFQSISNISGSLYSILKHSSGQDYKQGKKAKNITQGLYYGVKGFGVEVFQGITGVVTQPIDGARKKGASGCIVGVGKGILGLILFVPIGIFRASQSVSQGISGTADTLGNYFKTPLELLETKMVRIRPPRRIGGGGVLRIYNDEISVVNRMIKESTKLGIFEDQQIKFFCMLPALDSNGVPNYADRNLLVVTNEYILFSSVPTFFDFIKSNQFRRAL